MEHVMAPSRSDPLTRFTAKYVVQEDGCWEWHGPTSATIHKTNSWVYGMFRPGGRANNIGAHRWAYETFKGPISKGMQLDHLCRNTLCVNPDHLQPVTLKQNLNRGRRYYADQTHCKRGHEFTPENTYRPATGGRYCRRCKAMHQLNRYYRLK